MSPVPPLDTESIIPLSFATFAAVDLLQKTFFLSPQFFPPFVPDGPLLMAPFSPPPTPPTQSILMCHFTECVSIFDLFALIFFPFLYVFCLLTPTIAHPRRSCPSLVCFPLNFFVGTWRC